MTVGSTPKTWRLAGPIRALSGVAALVLLWEALTAGLHLPAWMIPDPGSVLAGLVANRAAIGDALARTAIEAAAGFVFGNLLGLGLAIAMLRSELLARVLLPAAVGLRTVPLVAIAPLLTLFFGFGDRAIIAMATLISFFPAMVNALIGFRSATPAMLEPLRVINASNWRIFWLVRWPASLPYLFAAFKVSAPGSVLAAMIAEWLAANRGLGYLILDAADSYSFALMWAGVVCATALAVLAFAAAAEVERRSLAGRGDLVV